MVGKWLRFLRSPLVSIAGLVTLGRFAAAACGIIGYQGGYGQFPSPCSDETPKECIVGCSYVVCEDPDYNCVYCVISCSDGCAWTDTDCNFGD